MCLAIPVPGERVLSQQVELHLGRAPEIYLAVGAVIMLVAVVFLKFLVTVK